MTTPRVTELKRRLKESAGDSFLSAPADEDGPLAEVVALRPRDGRRRRPRDRDRSAALHVVDPGDSAA